MSTNSRKCKLELVTSSSSEAHSKATETTEVRPPLVGMLLIVIRAH